MKHYIKLLAIFLFILTISCKKGPESKPNENELIHSTSAIGLTIKTGMTLAEINTVIAAANGGETVSVEPGTYIITDKVIMKAGVTLQSKTSTSPIFDATGINSEILTMSYGAELSDCLIRGITFYNIRFNIDNAQNFKMLYCVFDHGKRKTGTDKNFYADAYVHLRNTKNAIIDNCSFYRRAGNSGRGIWNTAASDSKITNNTIGDGADRGYFVTGINETATTNTIIQANEIRRNISFSDNSQMDHGIYAHSFNGVLIKDNKISGWPCNASGGSVKARNGQNITISGNTMDDSGILLYEYDLPAHPFLKKVNISYNTINIPELINASYQGISYWRNNTLGTEYSIRITHNIMPNGTIYITGTNVDINNFNAENGGVYNNDMGILTLKPGINNANNY